MCLQTIDEAEVCASSRIRPFNALVDRRVRAATAGAIGMRLLLPPITLPRAPCRLVAPRAPILSRRSAPSGQWI
jgi:hypothetical protein